MMDDIRKLQTLAAELVEPSRLPLERIARTQMELSIDPGTRMRLVPPRASLPAVLVVERGAPPPPWLFLLTARQREVARLIAAGLSNKAIAVRLGITVATVKDHVHGVLRRSGLGRRSAVAAALPGAAAPGEE